MEERMDEIREYFENSTPGANDHFENYRKNIVSVVAYLIGVSEDRFAEEGLFEPEEYQKLQASDKAKTIRWLCMLRTQFLKHYKSIDDARKYNLTSIEQMPDYIDVAGIKYLRTRGIEVNVANAKSPTVNIAYLNQYILDNIDGIQPFIPDWVNFKYVKSLFLMPGSYAGHNGTNIKNNYKKIYDAVLEVGKWYGIQRYSYPFQLYIHWPCEFKETDGNILYNDYKFLKMLYAANGDKFQAGQYVVDARSDKKEEIYDFLDEAINVAMFVDCENVDPYAFGATILNLDEDLLSKIRKIVLYDDVHTSTAWDYITKIMNIPVEKKDIKRLLDNKSLVDITMTAGVCEAYYRNSTESIILVSSDSDFWGLIQQLPQARFLVLNEYRKTSSAILEQLDRYGIKHCYMSDFAQDSIQEFKSEVLYLGLAERIKHFNETGTFGELDVDELLRQLFYDAVITGAENQVQKEKEAFFKKYLKNGLLLKPVTENGKTRLKIELFIK